MREETQSEPKDRGIGGFFSVALIKSFSDPEADLDRNEVIYLDELLLYTSREVRKEARKLNKSQNVFAVVPSTMTNIPLIQLADTFALPKKEIAFSGHITEDKVIEGIMHYAIEEATTYEPFFKELFNKLLQDEKHACHTHVIQLQVRYDFTPLNPVAEAT